MADVKKVDKTAEAGGMVNVGEKMVPQVADGVPETFTQAQAIYEAKEAVEAAARANVKVEEPGELYPSPRAKKEMAAGAAALGGKGNK